MGELFQIGEEVNIKLLGLNAFVTAICHRFYNTTYEISFFSNSEYKQIWVEGFEISRIDNRR